MGKSRRNRARGNPRADPIGKPVKPPSDPALAALRETKVLPVIKDLQSTDPKCRTKAAGAISNIVEDEKCRKLLLREQIVRIILTETITDTSLESRAAGWQILRVLVQEEDMDFCIHLYRLDVLTAISHAAAKILEALSSSEPPFAKLVEAQRRFIWSIGASVVDILSALAGAQDDIVDSSMKYDTITRFLLVTVSGESTPEEVRLAALSCLMNMAEDNQSLAQLVLFDEKYKGFETLHRLALLDGLSSALACGVLHNVFSSMKWHDQSKGLNGACDSILVAPLSKILQKIPSTPSAMTNGTLSTSVHASTQCLETLADIATYLLQSMKGGKQESREEPEWNGFEGDGDAEMEDIDRGDGGSDSDSKGDGSDDLAPGNDEMEDIEADMEMLAGFDDPEPVSGIDDLPTLSELLQKAVPQLIRISNIVDESVEAQILRERALSALGNLAWTLCSLDYSDSHNAGVQRAWMPVARKIWRKTISTTLSSDTADLGLARRVASLAWAISKSLSGEVPLVANEHQKFISLYRATQSQDVSGTADGSALEETEDPFLRPGVLCLGVLGQLALPPAPLPLNREIGVFLLTIVSSAPQSPLADVVEALEQLFDVYADEDSECDQIFWADSFLKHLEEAQPKIKAMIKGLDKRRFPELRSRADEAIMNLGRFIQYKRKHQPQRGGVNGISS